MVLDNASVIFCGSVVALVVSIFCWVLALTPGSPPWHRHWALGNTGMMLGLFLILWQGTWTPWITTILANTLMVGGYLLLESGVRKFCDRPFPRWLPPVHVVALVGGMVFFTFVWPNFPGRTIVHGLLSVGVMVRIALLLQNWIPEIRLRHKALITGFVGFFLLLAAVYVLRMVLVFWDHGQTVLSQDGSLLTLFLFIMVALVAWTFGFVFLDRLRTHGQLESALASRDKLFALIAHDLRGPVGSVSSLLDLLMNEKGLPQWLTEGLELCARSTRANVELLEKLLDWARSQGAGLELAPRPFGVRSLLEEAARSLNSQTSSKAVEVKLDVEHGLVGVGDELAVSSVVRNLISNAVKFSPHGSPVAVKALSQPEGIKIAVTDSGSGLPPKVLKSLEQGLLPASTPGTKGEKGTGLGLSLVRELVRRHHGTLDFQSGPGGTTAVVFLPKS